MGELTFKGLKVDELDLTNKIEAAKEAIYNLPKVKKFTKLYNQSKIEKYRAW